MDEISKRIKTQHAGIEVKALNIGMVESEEAPIEMFLSSDDNDLLIKEARRLKSHLLTIKGAKDPAISTDDITPEVRIELNREKIIAPKSKVSIFIGPLKAGKYPFFGEFNQATARGIVIAE
jgi:hypothetical protein